MKTPSRVIVTASDENYAHLCLGLLKSLGRWAKITYVLDLGLTEPTRRQMARLCAGVIPIPDTLWSPPDLDWPYLDAMTVRPQLPKIFEHEYIMWIDCDVWVQNRAAVATYFRAAAENPVNFAITVTVDPEYPRVINNYIWYQETFLASHTDYWGAEVAQQLFGKAIFNSGVMAASRHSPVWDAYMDGVANLYTNNEKVRTTWALAHMAEQQSLNRVLHESGFSTVLPSDYNWMSHAGPLRRRRFHVETLVGKRRPHVVHLADYRGHEAHYRENFLHYESRRARLSRFVRQRVKRLLRIGHTA